MGKAVKMRDSKNNYVYPCPYFPVGSIYLSVIDLDPSNYFGGTWERIQGRFLIGVGNQIEDNNTNWCGELNNESYNFWNGEMGGQYSHKLTTDEMPTHTHAQNSHSHAVPFGANSSAFASGWKYAWSSGLTADTSGKGWNGNAGTFGVTATNQNTGGSQNHNNLPPYLAVYMWKRIA